MRGMEKVSWTTQILLGTVKSVPLSSWGASSRIIKRYRHARFLWLVMWLSVATVYEQWDNLAVLLSKDDQVSVCWNQSDCQDSAIWTHLRGGLGSGWLSPDLATKQEGYMPKPNALCARRIWSVQRYAASCLCKSATGKRMNKQTGLKYHS